MSGSSNTYQPRMTIYGCSTSWAGAAGRPKNPNHGQMGYNETTQQWEVWDNILGAWQVFNNDSNPVSPVQAVNAAGTNQATAAALAIGYNRVTCPSSNNGAILPVPAAGQNAKIKLVGAGVLCVYPPVGCVIDLLAANAPFNMATNTAVELVAFNTTQWDTVPQVAS